MSFSLKKWAKANKYKIQMDESFAHETAAVKKDDKHWYEQIPTRCGGFIGLYQDAPKVILQFYTPKSRELCRRFQTNYPQVKIDCVFHGDEAIMQFGKELLFEVCKAIYARTRASRPPLSEEQKEKLREGLIKARAAKGKKG